MTIKRTVSLVLTIDDSGIGWEGTTPSDEELSSAVEVFVQRLLDNQIGEFDPVSGVTVQTVSNISVRIDGGV